MSENPESKINKKHGEREREKEKAKWGYIKEFRSCSYTIWWWQNPQTKYKNKKHEREKERETYVDTIVIELLLSKGIQAKKELLFKQIEKGEKKRKR